MKVNKLITELDDQELAKIVFNGMLGENYNQRFVSKIIESLKVFFRENNALDSRYEELIETFREKQMDKYKTEWKIEDLSTNVE